MPVLSGDGLSPPRWKAGQTVGPGVAVDYDQRKLAAWALSGALAKFGGVAL